MHRLLIVCALARAAHADPVYVEVLGKTGAYGVGYEHVLAPQLALGAEASYFRTNQQDVATGATYVHVEPVRRGSNALYGDLGVELAYSKLESAVTRWMGTSTTAAGGVATVGWEHDRGRWFVRTGLSLLGGKGGAAPWLGLALGRR